MGIETGDQAPATEEPQQETQAGKVERGLWYLTTALGLHRNPVLSSRLIDLFTDEDYVKKGGLDPDTMPEDMVRLGEAMADVLDRVREEETAKTTRR